MSSRVYPETIQTEKLPIYEEFPFDKITILLERLPASSPQDIPSLDSLTIVTCAKQGKLVKFSNSLFFVLESYLMWLSITD